eukprot:scaffold417608_cov41-Prasinocladus_malaysianus.AAC.3
MAPTKAAPDYGLQLKHLSDLRGVFQVDPRADLDAREADEVPHKGQISAHNRHGLMGRDHSTDSQP